MMSQVKDTQSNTKSYWTNTVSQTIFRKNLSGTNSDKNLDILVVMHIFHHILEALINGILVYEYMCDLNGTQ